MRSPARTFLFAGGGSGGHISPALAIAERLTDLEPESRSLFACSPRPIDRTMLEQASVAFTVVPGAPFSLRPAGAVRFLRGFTRARRVASELIVRESVDRVVAMGGFVAAPVVAAAARAGVPVTLINLDDPPGKANRWIARRCDQVLTAVELPRHRRFARQVTGMPIRRLAMAPGPPEVCRTRLGLAPDRPTLLVTGASQGARSLNALVTALAAQAASEFDGWQVLHLAGERDHDRTVAAWDAAGVRAEVRSFVHEMGPVWGAADLAISRAGASSVAEAWANAVPTVFMPYPFHRDRHQERNARPMADAGGAVIEVDHVEISANLPAAGATVRRLMGDRASLGAMRQKLRDTPAPDGAGTVAGLLLA